MLCEYAMQLLTVFPPFTSNVVCSLSHLLMYLQAVWTQIRLLPKKQSDQSPHDKICLKCILIYAADVIIRHYFQHKKTIGSTSANAGTIVDPLRRSVVKC